MTVANFVRMTGKQEPHDEIPITQILSRLLLIILLDRNSFDLESEENSYAAYFQVVPSNPILFLFHFFIFIS